FLSFFPSFFLSFLSFPSFLLPLFLFFPLLIIPPLSFPLDKRGSKRSTRIQSKDCRHKERTLGKNLKLRNETKNNKENRMSRDSFDSGDKSKSKRKLKEKQRRKRKKKRSLFYEKCPLLGFSG